MTDELTDEYILVNNFMPLPKPARQRTRYKSVDKILNAPTFYFDDAPWELTGTWKVRDYYDWMRRARVRQWVYELK